MGADVAQLDQLAATLDRQASQLSGSLAGTSAAMTNTWWMGPDSETTRAWWRGTASADVRGAAQLLHELAGTVRRQADEQRRASEAGGGGGGGGGGGPHQPPGGGVTPFFPFPLPGQPIGRPYLPITPLLPVGPSIPIMTASFLEGVVDIVDGEEDDDEGQSRGFGIPGPFDDWIRDGGESVVDRGSTLIDYAIRTTDRRIEHPIQSLVDLTTGTMLAEDVTAALQIGIGDAEIIDTPYGNDAVFLTDAWAPMGDGSAITIGHTVSVDSSAPPSAEIIDHEMQHVYDIEDVGGAGFYATYGGDYLWNRVVEGQSHDDAYRDIFWEQRGYGTGGGHGQPEGIAGGIWKDLWTIG